MNLLLLLLLDHNIEPLLEVFLQFFAALFEQLLYALNLRLEILQLIVLRLIFALVVRDLGLDRLFLGRLDNFSVLVNKTSHGILPPNLFNLRGVLLDSLARVIDVLTEVLAPRVLLLEQCPVVLHGLVLTIALAE